MKWSASQKRNIAIKKSPIFILFNNPSFGKHTKNIKLSVLRTRLIYLELIFITSVWGGSRYIGWWIIHAEWTMRKIHSTFQKQILDNVFLQWLLPLVPLFPQSNKEQSVHLEFLVAPPTRCSPTKQFCVISFLIIISILWQFWLVEDLSQFLTTFFILILFIYVKTFNLKT